MASHGLGPREQPSTAELTIRGIVLGGVITLVFTAANVYLGLKRLSRAHSSCWRRRG
jgi:uncharacterized oligopeptide transporter (OPT) family protein